MADEPAAAAAADDWETVPSAYLSSGDDVNANDAASQEPLSRSGVLDREPSFQVGEDSFAATAAHESDSDGEDSEEASKCEPPYCVSVRVLGSNEFHSVADSVSLAIQNAQPALQLTNEASDDCALELVLLEVTEDEADLNGKLEQLARVAPRTLVVPFAVPQGTSPEMCSLCVTRLTEMDLEVLPVREAPKARDSDEYDEYVGSQADRVSEKMLKMLEHNKAVAINPEETDDNDDTPLSKEPSTPVEEPVTLGAEEAATEQGCSARGAKIVAAVAVTVALMCAGGLYVAGFRGPAEVSQWLQAWSEDRLEMLAAAGDDGNLLALLELSSERLEALRETNKRIKEEKRLDPTLAPFMASIETMIQLRAIERLDENLAASRTRQEDVVETSTAAAESAETITVEKPAHEDVAVAVEQSVVTEEEAGVTEEEAVVMEVEVGVMEEEVVAKPSTQAPTMPPRTPERQIRDLKEEVQQLQRDLFKEAYLRSNLQAALAQAWNMCGWWCLHFVRDWGKQEGWTFDKATVTVDVPYN